MNKMLSQMEIYHKSGGVHGSALADKEKIYILAEDIGRHNTIDKVQGEYLLSKLKLKDGILLSTGRVTTEMLIKAAMMNIPIIISRTSPTNRAITMAKELGIALVGYVRDDRFFVYSHRERIIHNQVSQTV
jgi:FdhD protein